jgi:hypothetical protein
MTESVVAVPSHYVRTQVCARLIEWDKRAKESREDFIRRRMRKTFWWSKPKTYEEAAKGVTPEEDYIFGYYSMTGYIGRARRLYEMSLLNKRMFLSVSDYRFLKGS